MSASLMLTIMNYLEQVVFILLAGSGSRAVSVCLNAMQIRRNILMGKDKDMSGNKGGTMEEFFAAGVWQEKNVSEYIGGNCYNEVARWSKISLRQFAKHPRL